MRLLMSYPNKEKYYPVRSGNKLTQIKSWTKWAKKTSPMQNFILVNEYAIRMKDKEHKDYWKVRYKGGHEQKYKVYGSY